MLLATNPPMQWNIHHMGRHDLPVTRPKSFLSISRKLKIAPVLSTHSTTFVLVKAVLDFI